MKAVIVSSLLATASLMSLPTVTLADCNPRAIENETRFPMRAQLRGHRGTVLVKVQLDDKGRAIVTSLHSSSGHRLLDRAAEQSVRKHWVFDVSSCKAEELAETMLVAVEYRNAEYSPDGKAARDTSSLAALSEKESPK